MLKKCTKNTKTKQQTKKSETPKTNKKTKIKLKHY